MKSSFASEPSCRTLIGSSQPLLAERSRPRLSLNASRTAGLLGGLGDGALQAPCVRSSEVGDVNEHEHGGRGEHPLPLRVGDGGFNLKSTPIATGEVGFQPIGDVHEDRLQVLDLESSKIGRASCRERVWEYG